MTEYLGTVAFTAKANLYELVKALPAYADDEELEVWYTDQRGRPVPRKLIWLSEIDWPDEHAPTIGNRTREETFVITLTLESHYPGDEQTEANARIVDLLLPLQNALRDPAALGIPGAYVVGIEPRRLAEGTDAEGRGAIFVTGVRVRARK